MTKIRANYELFRLAELGLLDEVISLIERDYTAKEDPFDYQSLISAFCWNHSNRGGNYWTELEYQLYGELLENEK